MNDNNNTCMPNKYLALYGWTNFWSFLIKKWNKL